MPAGSLTSLTMLAIALVCARFTHAQEGPWQSLGPPGGNVISLAKSSSNALYLGTADGHLFVSEDAGQHWSLRGRVTPRHDSVLQKLLVNARDENDLIAAVWFQDVREGGGVYRSRDAGRTWTAAGLSGEILRTVEESPSDPEIFVAGTRSGIFRSTDGAESWQRISPAGDPELRNVDSLAIDPQDPQIIYAGTYHLPWKTTDAGKSWSAVSSGMIDDSDVMSLRVDAGNPARIFASACSGIYRSENAAAQWTKLQGIPFSSRRTQAIVQDPQNPRNVYAATTEGLWLTHDGGESWARATPRDWVVNDVVLLPAKSSATGAAGEILLGTEQQGILISGDGGQSFTPANQGFFHRITAGLVSDPRDANRLLAWMPDSPDALLESRDAGATWSALPVATAADAAPADLSRIFATDGGWWAATSSGTLYFYDAGAKKWVALKFAAGVVRRTHATPRGAPERRQLRPRPNTGAVLAAPSDITDVRTIGARVFVATPQQLWSGPLGEKILRPVKVATAPDDESANADATIWMMAAEKILHSSDAGKTWHSEVLKIGADLPATAVRWIRNVPGSTTVLRLAATTKGLYRQKSPNDSWQLVQNGLPATEPTVEVLEDGICVVALRTGGLYVSRDATQTWDRLDSGTVAGQFTGVAVTTGRHIVAASLTEGITAAF